MEKQLHFHLARQLQGQDDTWISSRKDKTDCQDTEEGLGGGTAAGSWPTCFSLRKRSGKASGAGFLLPAYHFLSLASMFSSINWENDAHLTDPGVKWYKIWKVLA